MGTNLVRKLVKKGELEYLEVTRERSILNSSINDFIKRNKNKDMKELLKD